MEKIYKRHSKLSEVYYIIRHNNSLYHIFFNTNDADPKWEIEVFQIVGYSKHKIKDKELLRKFERFIVRDLGYKKWILNN